MMSRIKSYVPLYRKYRPQQFSDLVGQEIVSTALQNTLKLSKIAHAYMFCGPRGTGKTSSARIFAKSLNCLDGPTVTPCHKCASCTAIANGTALDVTEIDAASNNGVDSIRDLTDKVQFLPIEGKFKIYIIDEVHMLSTAAFNALLKTLEEPPPNVIFIFATTEPHKVLPTIISRCLRFDFTRITSSQIENRLKQIAEIEGISISQAALTLIARYAKGGLRDALGLLDQVAVLGSGREGQLVEPEDVRAFIGDMEEEFLFTIAEGIISKDPLAILQKIQHIQERGNDPHQIVKELSRYFRNLLIIKTCGSSVLKESELLDVSESICPKLLNQSEKLAAEEIPQMLSKLSSLEYQLKNCQQPQLWLEIGLLDLCYRHDLLLVKQLEERVKSLEEAIRNNVHALPAATPHGMQVQPVSSSVKQASTVKQIADQPSVIKNASIPAKTDNQDLKTRWQRIVDSIDHLPTKALVSGHFNLVEVNENSILIEVSNESVFATFNRTEDKPNHLKHAINKVLGNSYKLDFKITNGLDKERIPVLSSSSVPATQIMQNPGLSADMEQKAILVTTFSDNYMHKSNDAEHKGIDNQHYVQTSEEILKEEIDPELQQAKQYSLELLQGTLID